MKTYTSSIMKSPSLRRKSGSRGASLLEGAIVIPVVLLVLFGVIDIGFYLYSSNVLRQSAHRVLTLASWVPGLDATAQTSEAVAKFTTAKATLKNKAGTSLTAVALGKGLMQISPQPEIGIFDLDSEEYANSPDTAFVVGLPPIDPDTQSRPFDRDPIGVRINATYRSIFLGWLIPPIAISGEARGFREKYPSLSVPVPEDCMGNPYNYPHTQPPPPGECCALKGGDPNDPCCEPDAVVNPLTGQCGGCPHNYKVEYNPFTEKHSCVCDMNSLGCGPTELVDEVNCRCSGRFCWSYLERRPDNTCGCGDTKGRLTNKLMPANCNWEDLCTWTADGIRCKNAHRPSYNQTNTGMESIPEHGTQTCACPPNRVWYGECGCYCKSFFKPSQLDSNGHDDGTSSCVEDCSTHGRVYHASSNSCKCDPPAPAVCPGQKIKYNSDACTCTCKRGMMEETPGSDSCVCESGKVPIVTGPAGTTVGCCPQCSNGKVPVAVAGQNCACACPPCHSDKIPGSIGTCIKVQGTYQEGGVDCS